MKAKHPARALLRDASPAQAPVPGNAPGLELAGAWRARRSWLVPTDRAGVETRLYADFGPFRGFRLKTAELDAAERLARLWREAQAGLERPRGLRTAGGGPEPTAEEEALAALAWREYGAALEAIRRRCGPQVLMATRAAVIDHAGSDPAAAQAGLAALAEFWGLV